MTEHVEPHRVDAELDREAPHGRDRARRCLGVDAGGDDETEPEQAAGLHGREQLGRARRWDHGVGGPGLGELQCVDAGREERGFAFVHRAAPAVDDDNYHVLKEMKRWLNPP